ncbi:MAG: hypothetical protein DMF94_04905 [Acidobacteria bacterium]|nr:MAG: hypothetical protein DMF94_04905 [Acidobacteriota bacterium]
MSAEDAGSSSREYDVRIPSLFEIFWGKLANWFRLLAKWRKQGLLKKALEAARRRRAMRLETLEPRVLLSADISYASSALDLATVDVGHSIDHTDFLDTVVPADAVDVDNAVPVDAGVPGDALKIDLGGASDPAADHHPDLPTTGDVKAAGGITLTVDTSHEAIFGVDQVVFVSFDGAKDVDYDGPVHIADVDVAAFRAPAGLEGHEAEIVGAALTTLEGQFSGSGLVFTALQPATGEYSTIYIGGDSRAFGDTYYGLSQKVDHGNADHSDIAFVFSENIDGAGLNAAQYGAALGGFAAHELGHLLGYEHAHTVGAHSDPLAEVAWKPYTHVEIAKDVLADVLDDGKLRIEGQDYAVHPKILQALQDYPQFYFAGSVGPDGFPDFTMGQAIIHPNDNATWDTRVLDMAWSAQNDPWFTSAEKSQILAWSYGFLTHTAGDHWAHTLMNDFAEGIFPAVSEIVDSLTTDQRELANALRHLLTEAYIGDATPGFDNNPDRTQLPDGDFSDNSTPGIPFDAPSHFIYEALIRPFAQDPTPIVQAKLGDDGVLTVDATTHSLHRSTGSFEADGFKVGQKITTSGFTNAANNGAFHVIDITDNGKSLTLSETTVVTESASAASGNETIKVFVPHTAVTSITVDDATNSFQRTTGSFKDDGFVPGQRFTAYGLHSYNGDYLVKSISADGLKLTVQEDLNSGYEVGTGDEQLVVQGSRGPALDAIFKLRDKIEMEAISRGPRLDFVHVLAQMAAAKAGDPLVTAPSFNDLANAYLYNWVDDINAGVKDWGDVGLAFTKAMFDPQSRRDLQNDVGESKGADSLDSESLRSKAEDGVGVLDVLFQQLDDPNLDHDIRDGYINRHLLSMFGLPHIAADARAGLHDVSEFIGNILEPLQLAFLPIEATIAEIKDFAKDFLKQQIEDIFNVSFEVFEFLTKMNSKMDLASIDIGGKVIPMFKPGDHEKVDALLGITPAAHHGPLPPGFTSTVTLPGATFTFYSDAEGPLLDASRLNKTTFAAYANSVTLTKMLLLMEDTSDGVGGGTAGDGQLSTLFSNILTTLNGTTTTYDFSLLNLNGAHGGNVITATLPGVPGTVDRPWLVSIDGDHIWRTDSYTTTTALFRVSTQDDTLSPAAWNTTVDAGVQYRIYATWQANVTQKVENLSDPTHPDQHLHPATNAQYTIKDGTTAFTTQPVPIDQRRSAGDPAFASSVEDGGLAFRLLGTYTFTGTDLNIQLGNQADGNAIAGPLLLQRVSDGAMRRIQNNRDPQTLAPTGTEYSDSSASWTDLVYETGTGNDPLWESQLLRPAFQELFTDWQNGALNFPALGDATSPDPNSVTIAKAEMPSHATPFGPFTQPADIDYSIGITGSNLLLRFGEDSTTGEDVLELVNNGDSSVIQSYLIGADAVLSVNIHPQTVLGLPVGGQGEDTLTVDLGFSGTPDSVARPSLHITFDGGDEILPNDLTTVDDVLRIQTTGTPFTLSALDIDSTESVRINGDITVLGDLSIDVSATDAAQYSVLVDLVHARSDAIIDVQGGDIQAGSITLNAVSTLGLDVAGFSLSVLELGVLDAHSHAKVLVHDGSLTSTSGGITLGASSAVRAWNQLTSNAGSSDATTDAAVATNTIGTDAFAKVYGSATIDSAAELHLTAGNSVDAKSTADGSKGGAGATLGLGVVVSDTEASIAGAATVDDATSLVLTASSDHKMDVLAKATPRGAQDDGDSNTSSKTQQGLEDPNKDGDNKDAASTSEGKLTLAGALAVNVLDDHTQALITSSGKVATTGALVLNAASSNVTSAKADGSTILQVAFDPSASSIVNASDETIDLGAKHGLHTGDKVIYHKGEGGTEFGLTDNKAYFVNVDGNKVSLYDMLGEAKTGNKADREDLTSGGAGKAHSLELDRGDSGVGIAVAVNVAVATTRAEIDATDVHAKSAELKALQPVGTFSAEAISGVGDASKTGFAGALAVNIAVTSATARLADNAVLTLTGGDVSITAQDHAANTAKASASQGGGAKTGVGASVALNIGLTDAHAVVGDKATLPGAHDLKLAADTANTLTTEATGGAKGGTARRRSARSPAPRR